MSSEWRSGKLGEFIELKRGYDLPKAKRISGAVPLVSSSGVSDFLAEAMVKGPGVITGRYGTIGQVYFVEQDFWPLNTTLYVRDFKGNDPKFVHYFLKTVDFLAYSDKAAVPGINRNHLHEALVALPEVGIQKSIAQFLAALDDRITLLRETNATLEAIAQALFKSWFVDFDPVHAKQAGRAPEGMSEATAALFPDSFEETALGLVPKGWRSGSLLDLATLNPESWTAKKHPDTVAYIDLANAKGNEIADVSEFAFDQAPSRARRVLRGGDTIVGTVRPGNRSFAFVDNPQSNLTASTGFAVLRPREIENTEFVYLAATQDSSIEHLAHVADGGAYPAVRPEVVVGIPVVLPSDEVMKVFHDAVAPLLSSISENQRRAQTLATLRDTLLPRLISGQLRLPEAERLVAAS
jgi:type I restriction enzyme S subunit